MTLTQVKINYRITPPWETPGKQIEKLIRKALHELGLVEGVTNLGLALSGGKDSMTLLYMLKAISGKGFSNYNITAFYVGGAFSCGASVEKRYLEKVCQELEVDLVQLESNRSPENLECYSCSRERRSLIFREAKKRGIERIAFGHHLDDQIETLMMNLCQKGSFEAILPKIDMIKYGITIIRPLIFVEEKMIIEFAKASGFARIMCQCPYGQTSKRKDSKDVIQLLEKVFPGSRKKLAKSALDFGSTKAARLELTRKDSL